MPTPFEAAADTTIPAAMPTPLEPSVEAETIEAAADAPTTELDHPPSEDHGECADLRIEPDDEAGDRDWLIAVDAPAAAVDPELVDRFARRLNRAKGVLSAEQSDATSVKLRMNRFGHGDLDSVDALVHRIWDQTRASHRGPAVAAV